MNNRKHPLPGSTLSRPAGGVLILVPFRRGLLVKRRVHEIQVLLIHLLLSQPQPFAKAYKMEITSLQMRHSILIESLVA